MTLISFPWEFDGAPTDADDVVFRSPDGAYGVRRADTLSVVLAAGTVLDHDGVGQYSYDVDAQAGNPELEVWIQVTFDDEVYRFHFFVDSDGAELTSKTLRFACAQFGELLVLEQLPKLSNPSSTFGVERMDTGETVVADDDAYTHVGGGFYTYGFIEPADDLQYRYYVEAIVGGVTYFLPRTTAAVDSAMLAIGRYTDTFRIEQKFGIENVYKWLALEVGDEPIDFAMRASAFIDSACDEIDDALRGSAVAVPLADPPATIIEIATALAGVRMYEARGVVDQNQDTGQPFHRLQYHATWVKQQIARLRAGSIRLAGETVTRAPVVVCE